MHRQKVLLEIEKDILQFQEALQTENNNGILEEKILDILGEIESKVSQIISDKKGRNILQIEKVFQRYLNLHQIESNYISIDDFLDTLISKLAQGLRERKTKLDFDLFEKGKSTIEGMGDSEEKIEMKTSQKNKIFLRVLHKIGIQFEDIEQFEETLNEKRMRKIPYQIYHINSGEYKKTVLICDQIGQATFIYDSLIAPEIFQVIEKGEEIDGIKALKIVYSQKSYQNNLQIALDIKLNFENKVGQIVNLHHEIADQEKTKLTQQHLFEKLWNYEGRNEQQSYNHFMCFGAKEINGLEILGNKIKSLKKVLGIEIEGNIKNPSVFQQWIDKVFEGKDIQKIEQLTQQQLFEKLWSYEGRNEQQSYNHFMSLGANEINDLEIGGYKIISLKKLSGIEIEGSIQNPSVFQQWIEKVFDGKDIKTLKEQILEQLWNYKAKSLQESYNHFMNLGTTGINELEIGGNKIKSLKTLSGIEIEGDIKNQSVFQQWIDKVFEGKDIKKIEQLTQQQLFEKLWSYEGRNEQQSYNHFMSFGAKEINGLEILGNKIKSLKKVLGIEIEGNIKNPSVFQQWIDKVFEGKDIQKIEQLTQQQLFEKLWSYEGRNEQQSYNHFMSFGVKEINGLEIGGNKIKSLKTLSGIEIEGDIKNLSVFQKLIDKVFEGKDIEKIEQLTQQQLFEKLWSYEGRNEQQSYNHFMSFGAKEVNGLEIGGNKIKSLKKLLGIEIEGNIQSTSIFQQWIDKVFEGKDIEKKNY